MTGVLGLLASAVGPFVTMWLLLRRTCSRELGGSVCVCAAWGLGTGVSSLVWWVLGQIPDVSATTVLWLDMGIWAMAVVGVATVVPRQATRQDGAPPESRDRETLLAFVVLLLISGLAAVTFAARSYVAPHGEWDAWAIWNARARAIFLGMAPPGGHTMPVPTLAHGDYPELLPRSIARAWTFAGGDDPGVPVVFAAMFAGFTSLLAAGSIRRRSNTTLGLLTAAFILASPALVNWTWSQGADVPLSLYVLLTFVFTASAVTTGRAGLWAFAGLSAGLAAWTKNEGVIFLIIVAMVVTVWTWRTLRPSVAAFAAGAAPAVLVLVVFKLNVTFVNELIAAQSLERLGAAFTWNRLSIVTTAIIRELWFGGATMIGALPLLGVYLTINGTPRLTPEARLTIAALTLMLGAYAMVYLLTPFDLQWHLSSSLDRLILQLMPSMVWAGMLLSARGTRQ